MSRLRRLRELEAECAPIVTSIGSQADQLRHALTPYANGKLLKGSEYVGWLGEVYTSILLGGSLVDDSYAHDLITPTGERISVKTRMGIQKGWNKSSAIPAALGADCPSHLVFVNLKANGTLRKLWKYDWDFLVRNDRLKPHMVRGQQRSLVFFVDEKYDTSFEIPNEEAEAAPRAEARISRSYSIDDLRRILPAPSINSTEPAWADDEYWCGAIARFHDQRARGISTISIDLDSIVGMVSSTDAVFRLMFAMHAVCEREGEDGFRGASQLVLAFLQRLAEAQLVTTKREAP